jgi:hypothetical protein
MAIIGDNWKAVDRGNGDKSNSEVWVFGIRAQLSF